MADNAASLAPADTQVDPALQDAILQQSIAEQQASEAGPSVSAQSPQPVAPPPSATPVLPPEAIQANLDAAAKRREGGFTAGLARKAEGINNLVQVLGGAADEAGFQAHDFLFGPTPEDKKSTFRTASENQSEQLVKDIGPVAGFTKGIGQFGVGLIGLGKLTWAAKAVPVLGEGIAAVEGFLGGSKAVVAGKEAIKAATVGATMFDPHAGRLSDLLVQYPLLNNTVTKFLASSPEDSDAQGRMKNALESLGMDAAGALFVGTLKLYKALGAGDKAGVEAATAEVQRAQRAQRAGAPKGGTTTATVDGVTASNAPEAAAPAPVPSAPTATVETARQLKDRFTGADGQIALGTSSDRLSQEVGAALSQGKTVSIFPDGKPIQIVAVANGMMQDAKGQRWGIMPLLSKVDMDAPAVRIEGPAGKPRVSVKADLGATVPEPTFTPKEFLDAAEGNPLTPPAGSPIDGGPVGGAADGLPSETLAVPGGAPVRPAPGGHDAGQPSPLPGHGGPGDIPGGPGSPLPAPGSAEAAVPGEVRPPDAAVAEGGGARPSGSDLGGPQRVPDGAPASEHPGLGQSPAAGDGIDRSSDIAKYRGKPTPAVRVGGRYFIGATHADAIEKAVQQFGLDSPEIKAFENAGDPMENIGMLRRPRGAVSQTLTGQSAGGFRADISGDRGAGLVKSLKGRERAAPAVEVSAVPTVTEGLAPEGISGPKGKVTLPKFNPALVTGILQGTQKDWDALDARAWDWEGAVADGHEFASSPNTIPYNKMAGPADVEALVAQTAQAVNDHLNAAKGGEVLTDALVQKRLGQWLRAFNIDPATMMGELTRAGKAATDMVAHMEAGFVLANRAFQDATATAWKITSGNLDDFGGDAALAHETMQQQLAVATQFLGSAQAIRAAGGRAVRRGRAEFMPTAQDIAALRGLSGDTLAQLLTSAKGNIKNLRKITQPGFFRSIQDYASFLYVNNLLWGWKTHVVNLTSNTIMLGLRPTERIIGSVFTPGGASVREQALRQYVYMGASLADSWNAAKEAFLLGDSKIAPHNSELYGTVTVGSKAPVPAWKPITNVADLGYNALVAGSTLARTTKGILGFPTRILGASDEMSKMITYRSLVMSKAYMEGKAAVPSGATQVEAKQVIQDTINKRLDEAFDDRGFATDMGAKQEAQVATFSQDLNGGVIASGGKMIQAFSHQYPAARVVVPFIKTPTNILQYGIDLTPGLNMFRKQFRDAFFGKLGDTPQARTTAMAQARGQMALGVSFVSLAAYLASQGRITGAGPADDKARKDLMATGWQPYSFRTVNDDGSVSYNSFAGRLDPVVMPFGIIADVADATRMLGPDDPWVQKTAMAAGLSVIKQVNNKAYLSGLTQFLDLLNRPDEGRFNKIAGGIASNMIPMSSMLRQVNGLFVDDTMRDARSIADKMRSTVPGLSDQVPPKRDAWGDLVYYRPGFSTTTDGHVDNEMERLTMDTEDGKSIAGVLPGHTGADLRTVTMVSGRNAYDRLQELSGHLPGAPPLKTLVAKVMESPVYRNAPDGAARIKGTKLYMLGSVINPYHDKALKVLRQDPEVRKALYAENEKARAAYATAKRDPQGAIPQAKALNDILGGVGLPTISAP